MTSAVTASSPLYVSASDIGLWYYARSHSLLFLLSVAVAALFLRYIKSPWRYTPPGPRGFPLLGNLLALRDQRWLFSPDCREKYGDIIFLNVLGQPTVILNSQEVAADLLDRRANIYSDRPHLILGNDICCGGHSFVLSSYGDRWRRMRRAAHEALSSTAIKDFYDVQRKEAILLASHVLADASGRDSHFRRATASSFLSIIYDLPTIQSEHDVNLMKVEHHIDRHVKASAPGAHLVEIFTWMRFLPSWMAKWKREAEKWYERDSAMFEGLVDQVQANLEKGMDRPSLAASLLRDEGRVGLSVRERAWLTGGLYVAGSETTPSTLQWWTLAMIAYPDTQRRAQAELDAVVGRDRLPTFADLPYLPYLRALVKEVLRWRPTVPLGIPHRLSEDDWYKGMFIPAGTICFGNIYQCNRDPDVYGADAAHFEPARHLDAEGAVAVGPAETKEEGHVMFGFGRRICIGRHVANNALAIDIAIVLWAASLEAATDANGQVIPLDVDNYNEVGIVSRPVPFGCTISPRFPEAPILLAAEREQYDI
ncbi:cytochrome P450 [Auriscalpium vulgare]|uniref:Cytochrome P450 n=1 Tax=Auriscalpium vulgare TaxID=40419 RepID=A0ACB8S1B3_9AGAM|nr:cytochrome P450 [Auriscalpium vulgare]